MYMLAMFLQSTMFFYLNFVAIFQLVFYFFYMCKHLDQIAYLFSSYNQRFSSFTVLLKKKTNILSNNLGMTRRQRRILDQIKYINIMFQKMNVWNDNKVYVHSQILMSTIESFLEDVISFIPTISQTTSITIPTTYKS